METKFTKGGWVVDGEDNLVHAVDERHTIICHLSGNSKNPDVMADANLIAAAPGPWAYADAMLAERKKGG